MLELYVIRHGLAGKSQDDDILDEERPLTKKGKEKLKDIAKCLRKHDIHFDMVLSSPLLRAQESAEIINDFCGEKKDVTITELLSPDASFNNLIKLLNKFKDATKVAIVGHEPFLGEFASYLLTANKKSFLHIKKGGVLVLEIDGVIKPGKCMLSWLMDPKHIIQDIHK